MPDGRCHLCFTDIPAGQQCRNCVSAADPDPYQGDVLPPGSILGGKFTVGRLLGRGGFGATYLSWDMNLRVRVAIKEFLPRQLAGRSTAGSRVNPYSGEADSFRIGLDQFLDEARNLAHFRDHPGIISVLDFFPENGTGYMVMEYLDGETLEQSITRAGRLEPGLALRLIVPVADALRACHATGLIHRDVSPDNIFITSDGRVKLLDFGAARIAMGTRSTKLSVILKVGYAPFEQYHSTGRQGPWTDVYALTATLYRLLTGDLPTPSSARFGGMPLPPLAEKGLTPPPGLQALIDKGMAIHPEQRYQTVAAFLEDLQAVQDKPEVPAEPGSTRRRDKTGTQRRSRTLDIVAGTVLAAGITAFFVLPGKHPSPLTSQNETVQAAVPKENPKAGPARQTMPSSTGAGRDNPVESARGFIRQAAQYQNQVALALTQRKSATGTLQKLEALKATDAATKNAINMEQNLYNSADLHLHGDLDKYFSQIELLAARNAAAVEAAIELERESANAPSLDKSESEARAAMNAAIPLIAQHVRTFRQGSLTADIVASDVEHANTRRKL